MTYIPVHCPICDTSLDLEIDEHGCALGVCNCDLSEERNWDETSWEVFETVDELEGYL